MDPLFERPRAIPLLIKLPNGDCFPAAEIFRHPLGAVAFEINWCNAPRLHPVHVIEGEIVGNGPWSIGEALIRELNLAGLDDERYWQQWNHWQDFLLNDPIDPIEYKRNLFKAARNYGAIL